MIKKNFIDILRRSLFLLSLFFILISCNHPEDKRLPGYIEGKYTYISTMSTGLLTSMQGKRGDEIKQGQLLFSLESKADTYDLNLAKQRVNQAKEQQNALNEVYKKNKNNKESYYNLQAAKRNLSALQASLDKTEWILKQKNTYAPTSGVIFNTFYSKGEFVQAGNPILALLNPEEVKIIFYSPEPYLSKIKLGDKVQVYCDNCKNPIMGKIVFISPQAEYTPPVIYSNEEREKLSYRVEATPLITKSYFILHPGQPIAVRLINQ